MLQIRSQHDFNSKFINKIKQAPNLQSSETLIRFIEKHNIAMRGIFILIKYARDIELCKERI